MGRRTRNPDVHVPLWRQTVNRWSEAQRQEWEERAAIKEYCAGLPRDEAEREAFHEVASKKEYQT